MADINKARRIVRDYKAQLTNHPYGKPCPIYFKNWANRILNIEYLILEHKYKSKW